MCILSKEGIILSDIHGQLLAVCGEKASVHRSLFNWVWNFKCGKETEPAAVHEWYCNNPKE
jgi:hypothetical protein